MLTRNVLHRTFLIGSLLLCAWLFTDIPFISAEEKSLRTGKKKVGQIRKISELEGKVATASTLLSDKGQKRTASSRNLCHTQPRQPHVFHLLPGVLLTTWPAFDSFSFAAQSWSFHPHLPCCFLKPQADWKHLTDFKRHSVSNVNSKNLKNQFIRNKYINRWVLMM